MTMKVSELKSHDSVVGERRAADPAYVAEVDRLALANAVSVAVVEQRAQRGLTQSQFAALLGWKQPQVARLERGDVTPSVATLQRLARAGVLVVHVEQDGTVVEQPATA